MNGSRLEDRMTKLQFSFDLISKNLKNLDNFTRRKLHELNEGRPNSRTEKNPSAQIENENGKMNQRQASNKRELIFILSFSCPNLT